MKLKIQKLVAATCLVVLGMAFAFYHANRVKATDFKPDANEVQGLQNSSPADQVYRTGQKLRNALYQGKPFRQVIVLSSSTFQSSTPTVSIVPDSETVTLDWDNRIMYAAQVYINNFKVFNSSGVQWVGAGSPVFNGFSIYDSTMNLMATISTYSLAGNMYTNDTSTQNTITQAMKASTGSADGYGLFLQANSTVSAGSPLTIVITGVIY